MPKVLVLMDVANLYFCLKEKFGQRLDYFKFYKDIHEQYQIHRAIAYGAYGETESEAFINMLQKAGFEPFFKKVKVFRDGNRKANCDVEIAVDAMRMLHDVDILIIGSADGDFSSVIKYAQAVGKRCYVYGCGISRDLIELADRCVELEESDLDRR